MFDNIIENIKLRLGYKEEVTITRDELDHLLKDIRKIRLINQYKK